MSLIILGERLMIPSLEWSDVVGFRVSFAICTLTSLELGLSRCLANRVELPLQRKLVE